MIVRSNGVVTYVGKDIAYQFWKLGLLGRDFHYRVVRARGRTATAVGDDVEPDGDGRSSAVRRRRVRLQRHRRAPVATCRSC